MPVLTLQPSTTGKDTYIDAGNPTFNYGASTLLSMTGASPTRITFIQFDLSSIPANVAVTSAILTLTNIAFAGGPNISVNRITTDWFEGQENGAAPTGGRDGSTWNLRNAIGSVPYTAGPGGDIGPLITNFPFSSFVGGGANNIDLTAEVKNIYKGLVANKGWSFVTGGSAFAYTFASSEHATVASRPKLVITYSLNAIAGASAGSSTVTGSLKGRARMVAALAASSSWYAEGLQPGAMGHGDSDGLATVTGTLKGYGLMRGTAAGTSTATADLTLYGNLPSGSAAGTSTATGHLMAYVPISGSAAGISTATGTITMVGHLRGSAAGSSSATGTLWGNAVGKVQPQICTPTPLLYITDGTFLPNGQRDLLDLLSVRGGFLLSDWNPSIAQYKSGGYFSDSAAGNGRRLSRRVFENAIEVMTLSLRSDTQDRAIWYSREYLRWQELAADYWTSDWAIRPVYLVARAAKETKTRYAIIHVMSIGNFFNPYSQPFFSVSNPPAMNGIGLRIEREPWTDVPPGESEVVPISSIRSWTVAGWVAS